MSKKKLAPKFSKTNLRYASQSAVVDSFKDLKKIFSTGSWLSKKNRYRLDTTTRLQEDLNNNHIREKHLTTYIGASSVGHCFDGWKYLGRAISSATELDLNTARHLAYYAELRATMSILSSQGIAIFKDRHIILSKNKIYSRKGPSTHPMAWEGLGYFANKRGSAYSLLSIIKPDQHSLNDWLTTLGIDTYREKLGREWLKTWGLDIKRFSLDQEVRNYLSYRPSQINEKHQIDFKYLVKLIHDIWESSEFPTFTKIDAQLLRRSMKTGFEFLTGTKVEDHLPEYEKRISSLVWSLAPTGYSPEFWIRYLTDFTDESIIIKEAFGTADLNQPNQYIQMISRAFLLLRIASGYVKQNFEQAGITGKELKFWWSPLIKHLGYTNEKIEENELNDVLFTDAISCKDSLYAQISNPRFSLDTFSWVNNYFEDKIKTSQLERIGIVAIAS